MTDSQPTNGIAGLPVSVWIALILGAVGVFALTQNPFQDTRPPNTTVPLNRHSDDDGERVEARLWEDPLSAVATALAHSGRNRPGASSADKLWLRIKDNVGKKDNDGRKARTLVLGVMVTGEPYADDMETRRRTRYSVLAGLYRSGFVPVNADHVGLARQARLEGRGRNAVAELARGTQGSERPASPRELVEQSSNRGHSSRSRSGACCCAP